jgi:hypothetical protein
MSDAAKPDTGLSTRETIPFLAAVLLGALAAVAVMHFNDDLKIVEAYERSFRQAMFTGFLTLGGFLLSLKTFVLIKMKEGMFDSPSYVDNLKRLRSLNASLSHYGPLLRLSRLLFISIFFSVGTSALQITLGMWVRPISVALCCGSAVATLVLLFTSLFVIRANLNAWLHSLEIDSKAK